MHGEEVRGTIKGVPHERKKESCHKVGQQNDRDIVFLDAKDLRTGCNESFFHVP